MKKPNKLHKYFTGIYNEIQDSRKVRRDAGFETGPAVMMTDGSPWFRNVDPLPPFKEWMGNDLDICYDEEEG